MTRSRTVARGVEMFSARTPTLPPATHTNSYAIGEREVVLIEPATPYEDERREWLSWARGLISQGRRLLAIAVTHHHIDHVGGAEFLAKELGAPLWAHEQTASRLGVKVDRRLDEGETLVLEGQVSQSWRVMHTPGHAPGHVCLFEETSRISIVGDMVASVGTILIAPGEGDMAEYLSQLERLAGLDANMALPAHGDPIAEEAGMAPTSLFRYYITHRLGREAKVMAALIGAGEEGGHLESLLAVAYADTPVALWPIAKLSLEAHLLKLEKEGKARRGGRGWVRGI